MFRPPFAYDRARVQAQVIERLEAGCPKARLAELPGFPSRATLHRWIHEDPAFARRVAAAVAWGRGLRQEGVNRGQIFDAARAEAFLLRVRRGEPVNRLVWAPGQPRREVLNLWKRLNPDFATALAEAVAFARAVGDRRRSFDPAVADAMICRVTGGETVRALWKDPAMPGEKVLRRWQAQRPDFAAALKAAWRIANRRRMAARPRCSPAVIQRVARHIRGGGCLLSASKAPGMPCAQTFYAWRRAHAGFREAIEVAETERDERLLDQALIIADEMTPETLAADTRRLAAIHRRVGRLSRRS